MEPPRDESKRSSFTSSSLRSSLNHVVLFFERERERESLRFKEEEDGAHECISIKISFTNLLSYVNTQIFLKYKNRRRKNYTTTTTSRSERVWWLLLAPTMNRKRRRRRRLLLMKNSRRKQSRRRRPLSSLSPRRKAPWRTDTTTTWRLCKPKAPRQARSSSKRRQLRRLLILRERLLLRKR